jgi:anaerobic C4-dicarboxylate transporter DcuB
MIILGIQFLVVLGCLLVGSRYGGIGLGLISGIGLFILTFLFNLLPGKAPVDVMLTILSVVACASVLQTAGGLSVMIKFSERILRRHPKYITILAPLVTFMLTILCGTGHVVYTMYMIIYDIAIKNNIRPERPMAVASVASQMGICASPVSVAVVSLVSILGTAHGVGHVFGIGEVLCVVIPSSLVGVLVAALWSLTRGKDLDKDPIFQAKIMDPAQKAYIYDGSDTLLNTRFPKEAYWATGIFFAGIAIMVVLGFFPKLLPSYAVAGHMESISMNLVIQMLMLITGAVILLFCKVKTQNVTNSPVFKAGMVAVIVVFGVAWLGDTFFQAHLSTVKKLLGDAVASRPWLYGIVLILVSKMVNSQAAAIVAVAPIAVTLGVDPRMMIAFFPAAYGYFILPTYPSDLACIGFDRSGSTGIGKLIINHSFLIPGLIGVGTSCTVCYLLVTIFM